MLQHRHRDHGSQKLQRANDLWQVDHWCPFATFGHRGGSSLWLMSLMLCRCIPMMFLAITITGACLWWDCRGLCACDMSGWWSRSCKLSSFSLILPTRVMILSCLVHWFTASCLNIASSFCPQLRSWTVNERIAQLLGTSAELVCTAQRVNDPEP